MKIFALICLVFHWNSDLTSAQIPVTDETWVTLQPAGGSKWSPRNAHASCAFKDRLWLTGGRSDLKPLYNLQNSFLSADVWLSANGADWGQASDMRGDYFAQNYDALQPGNVAPWYPRFAHTLTPLDMDHDGVDDVMILMGGYAPSPINDVWITSDGFTWAFAGYADWSPRAWHGATAFNGTIWVVGGTPISNDIWFAESITYFDSRREPLTRAMFLPYRYEVTWKFAGNAAFSPRAAMGLVTQYFKPSANEEGYSRMILIGGYGGYTDERADGGLRCRAGVWTSTNGYNWTQLTFGPFGGIAFMGLVAWEPNATIGEKVNQRLWVVGGGYIGDSGNRQVLSMQGSVNTYWSKDGINWVLVNFVQGGGITGLSLYSSNEWSRTTIDGVVVFLGLWGLTLNVFSPVDASGNRVYPGGALYILGGDQEGAGVLQNNVYRASFGLKCQILGISCNGNGFCSEDDLGCICLPGFTGEFCEEGIAIESAALRVVYTRLALFWIVGVALYIG